MTEISTQDPWVAAEADSQPESHIGIQSRPSRLLQVDPRHIKKCRRTHLRGSDSPPPLRLEGCADDPAPESLHKKSTVVQ
jgi:hypothetical protein